MLRTFSPWRLRLIGWALTLAFLVCAGRLYYLHIIANPKLQQISENNRVRLETHPAKRGEITDIRGELIATHQTRFVVGMDAKDLTPTAREKLPQLARVLGLPLQTLTAAAATERRWVKLKEGVNESTYSQVQALKMKGVYGYPTYDRIYPKTILAAHLVGYVNKEDVATGGVERMMDFYLKGQDGWREIERDGHRRELGQFRSRDVPPKDGMNVELTIDLRVQSELEEQLKKIVAQYRPDGVSIIVSDPKTGYLLGLANYPSFDPNRYNQYPISHLKNSAISDVLEPGSTFKIVTVAAGLEERLITPETVFDCDLATIMYKGREIKLPKEHERMGRLNVRDVVAQSSNKASAQIGMRLGEDKMYAYSRAFGYGSTTGLGLGGESAGILMPVNRWDGLTISRLPMGHAIAATPLQIHYATSVIASDGVLMQPIVVKRVYDDAGNTILNFPPRPKRQVLSPSTAALMRTLMIKTVSPQGTAVKAMIPGYEVAGKTGTTQKLVEGRYSNREHVASFSGFLPARAPQIVVTVIIDNARSKGVAYGGQLAAPVFKDIASRLIQHLAIAPVEEIPTDSPKTAKK